MRFGAPRLLIILLLVACGGCKHAAKPALVDAGPELTDATAVTLDAGEPAEVDAGPTAVVPCDKDKSAPFSLRFGLDGRFNSDVGVDSCGNVVLAGSFKSPIDFGGGPLASDGSEDIFMAKFASDGAHVWSKKFGDQGKQHVRAVGIGPDDDIYMTGDFDGTVEFGGKPLTREPTYQSAIYLVRLDTTGKEQFSRFFVDTGSGAAASSLAVDKDGSVVLAGKLAKQMNLGGGPLSEDLGGIFIAKYNKFGGHQWSRSIASQKYPNAVSVSGVAIGASGDIVLAGTFENTLDVSKTVSAKSNGKSDVYLALFDTNGEPKWVKHFGDKEPNGSAGVVTDSAGDYVTMQVDERKIPGGPEWRRGHTLTIRRFDPKGKQIFQKSIQAGKSGIDEAQLAVGPREELVVSGTLSEDASLGGKTLEVPKGEKRLVVATFDAKGGHRSSEIFGNEEMPFPRGLVVGPNGAIVVAGTIDPRPNAQAKMPSGKQPFDVFLQKIVPGEEPK